MAARILSVLMPAALVVAGCGGSPRTAYDSCKPPEIEYVHLVVLDCINQRIDLHELPGAPEEPMTAARCERAGPPEPSHDVAGKYHCTLASGEGRPPQPRGKGDPITIRRTKDGYAVEFPFRK